MVKLPSDADLGGLPSARTSKRVPHLNLTGPGAAMADMGRQIAGLSAGFSALGNARDGQEAFDTEKRFQEFKYEHGRQLRDQIENMEPGSGRGFGEAAVNTYFESARGFLDTVPEKQKEKYDARLFEIERTTDRLGHSAERLEQRRSSVNQLEDHKNFLADNAEDLDEARADYDAYLKANPDLTPIEKDTLRRQHIGDLEYRHIQNRINSGDDLEEIWRDVGRGSSAAPQTTSGASQSGLDFIKKQEGYTSQSKWDVRQYSIGYGTRGRKGEVISKEEAEQRLQQEAGKVSEWIGKNIQRPLTQNQHDALVSFGFNLGTDDLEKLRGDIEKGNDDRVATRMLSYNRAGGRILEGLKRRRRDEASLYMTEGVDAGTETTAAGAPVEPGNIDLANRQVVAVGDDKSTTVHAMSIEEDGKEILIPTITPDGEQLSEKDARALYAKTGEHLGKFRSVDDADDYTQTLSGGPGKSYAQAKGASATDAGKARLPMYPNLTPKIRRALEHKLRNAGSARARIDADDLIAEAERTGEVAVDANGRNALDRNKRYYTQAQRDTHANKLDAALRKYHAIAPLDSMTEDQALKHISKLLPQKRKEGDSYATAARVYDDARKAWSGIEKLRSEDPAQAVSLDNSVKDAVSMIAEQGKTLGLSVDEHGNIAVAEGDGAEGADPQTRRRIWGMIFEARLEAQERRGISDDNQLVITRREAQDLLRMDQPQRIGNTQQYRAKLEEAAERATALYGSEHAERVLADAIGLQRGTRSKEKMQAEDRILAKVARGDVVGPADLRLVEDLESVDRVGRMLEFTPTPTGDMTKPYIMQPNMAGPGEDHVNWLKENISDPRAFAIFDGKFGKGAAMRALKGSSESSVSTSDYGLRPPAQPKAQKSFFDWLSSGDAD